jgi:hypothetical protein
MCVATLCPREAGSTTSDASSLLELGSVLGVKSLASCKSVAW